MDPINEAYKESISMPISEGKKLDWQKVWNKSFKMKIGDTLSSRDERDREGDKISYYTNYDYQIIDIWLEAKHKGDDVDFEVMVKIKRQNHGDKDTVILPLKDVNDGKESFESNVNYPNG